LFSRKIRKIRKLRKQNKLKGFVSSKTKGHKFKFFIQKQYCL